MKLFLLLLLLALASVVFAQTNAPETLTNEKIITMVKGGLPKAAILASIKNKPASYDLTTDAMITLKKQGVADEIITAMVDKGSEQKTVTATKQTLPTMDLIPDKKGCSFVKAKSPDGQTFSMIQTAGKLGNFLIGKGDGKITLVYSTKVLLAMFATDTKNLASLKIDSTQFLFADNTVITLKTVNGLGTLPNQNNELKKAEFRSGAVQTADFRARRYHGPKNV